MLYIVIGKLRFGEQIWGWYEYSLIRKINNDLLYNTGSTLTRAHFMFNETKQPTIIPIYHKINIIIVKISLLKAYSWTSYIYIYNKTTCHVLRRQIRLYFKSITFNLIICALLAYIQ